MSQAPSLFTELLCSPAHVAALVHDEVRETPEGRREQTITEAFHVIGPKGQQIIVKGVFHVTVVGGTTIVEIEKGNHDQDEVCESGFVLTPT